MKKLVTIITLSILLTITVFTPVTINAKTSKDIKIANKYCKKHYNVKKYKIKYVQSNKLTDKKLVTRKKNKIIYIEVVQSKSNGKYGYTKDGSYITYNKKVKKGKKVVSYLIYNPNTTYYDDIVAVVDNGKIR